MALLPYLKKETLPAPDQEIILDPMHIYELMAHNPDTARAMLAFGAHVRKRGTLSDRLRELLILQVGYVCKCAYEYSHHIKVAERIGMKESEIRAIALETAGQASELDPRTRLALLAARQITTEFRCDEATDLQLREHFSPAELVDIIVTVGFYNMIVRFLETMKIDVEESYLPYLEKYPMDADVEVDVAHQKGRKS